MVEGSFPVHPLKSMGAEVVPLGLDEIGPQVAAPQGVQVLCGAGKRRDGDATQHGAGYGLPQGGKIFPDLARKEIIQQEISEAPVFLIGLRYPVQEFRLDDAARAEVIESVVGE